MEQVDKQTLIFILENGAKSTPELSHCKAALLIGSQAAYLISQEQRKPKDSADWDFIISASYLLSWLKGEVYFSDVQMMQTSNDVNASSSQEPDEKKSLFSSMLSKISFMSNAHHGSDPTSSGKLPFLSIQLTLLPKGHYRWNTHKLDVEVPLTLQSSAAQLLLFEFGNQQKNKQTIPFQHDQKLKVKVASLETLLALKKSTYHPAKWLHHTEDYHNLAKLDTQQKVFSKKMLEILDARVKEASVIYSIAPNKNVDEVNLQALLQNDPEVQSLIQKCNNNSWKIQKSQLQQVTDDSMEFIAQVILAYTRQNKLFSPLSSLQILATSKSPAMWWTDFLRDQFPRFQQLFEKGNPVLAPPEKDTSTSLPTVWLFPHVPLDIALQIASNCDITSFFQASRLSAVCKSWKTFFTNDLVWKAMFQAFWKDEPVEKVSWKSNFIIRNNLTRAVSNADMNSLIRMTAQFQQTTVNDLVQLWHDLLQITQPPVSLLKLGLTNIARLQWMIQHTFIVQTSQAVAQSEDSPCAYYLTCVVGCSELPHLKQRISLVHRYGERGTSRFSIEAHELTISNANGQLRRFDGPELYGLYYGGWGLEGNPTESSYLSTETSSVFKLPEGIVTAFFIHLAECQSHVKSYFTQEWKGNSWR